MAQEGKCFKLNFTVDRMRCAFNMFYCVVCVVRGSVIVTDTDIGVNPAGFVCMKRSFGGNFGGIMTILDISCSNPGYGAFLHFNRLLSRSFQ